MPHLPINPFFVLWILLRSPFCSRLMARQKKERFLVLHSCCAAELSCVFSVHGWVGWMEVSVSNCLRVRQCAPWGISKGSYKKKKRRLHQNPHSVPCIAWDWLTVTSQPWAFFRVKSSGALESSEAFWWNYCSWSTACSLHGEWWRKPLLQKMYAWGWILKTLFY